MIPQALRHQLARLRRRQRLGAFAWGGARWLALAISLLFIAGIIDWTIDRERDTPAALRRLLAYAQIAAGLAASFYFIVRPLTRRLSNVTLALYVEDRIPQFNHRLISAVELNRPGAATLGMSPALIQRRDRGGGEPGARRRFCCPGRSTPAAARRDACIGMRDPRDCAVPCLA